MRKLGVAAVAIAGALVGGLIFERDTLVCNRDSRTCTLSRYKIYRTTSETFPVAELKGAELKENSDDDGSSYEIVVLTTGGPKPLMGYATGLFIGSMQEQVNAIARFASRQSLEPLEVEHTNVVISIIVGMFAFIFVGAIVLVSAETIGRR